MTDTPKIPTPSKAEEANPVPDGSTLEWHEHDSLTIWGEHVSAQVRAYTDLTGDGTDTHPFAAGASNPVLALLVQNGAPRSRENGRPYELPAADARKLRDVLNAATARGLL